MKKWQVEHPAPAKVFADEPSLPCAYCGKELLQPKPHGIVVVWTSTTQLPDNKTAKRTEEIYWCCRGACDDMLRKRTRREGWFDGWEDISDLTIPTLYIRWIMTTYNEIQGDVVYSDAAFDNTKEFLLNLFPLVCRHATAEEQQRIKDLGMIPSFLGGLGY